MGNRTNARVGKELLIAALVRAEDEKSRETEQEETDVPDIPSLDWRMLYETGKKRRGKKKRRLQKAAAFAGLILVLSGTLGITVEANRNAIKGWFVRLGEKSDSIHFDVKKLEEKMDSSDAKFEKEPVMAIEKIYEPAYLPDGFILSGKVRMPEDQPVSVSMEYTDGGRSICFTQEILTTGITVDSEEKEREEVEINGYKGQLNYGNGDSIVVWRTDEYCFSVSGDIDREEILKIARSVK